jgi:hypothetical protein
MDVPRPLWPLQYHGVDFVDESGDQLVADCPFCGKEGHFYANKVRGLWDCKKCGASGNTGTFLRQIAADTMKGTRSSAMQELARDRGVSVSTLKRWFLGKRADGRWLIPVFNTHGLPIDIRVYLPGDKTRSTRGCKTGLLGVRRLMSHKDETVYLCEGEWDAISLDYFLRRLSLPGVVLAVPGAGVMKEEWADFMVRRDVVLLYDNDRIGLDGMKRAGDIIAQVCNSTRYVHWPSSSPTGFDVRDFVTTAVKERKTKAAWKVLQTLLHPHHPYDRQKIITAKVKTKAGQKGSPVTFEAVCRAFAKWYRVTEEFELALRVTMAAALSNGIEGKPIWIFIVGPPSGGKTSILETLGGSEKCILRSNLTARSLISGWRSGDDVSEIPQFIGNTVVIKDFTELLSMSPTIVEETMGTLRGAFDGSAERQFGNGVKRAYKGFFTLIAAVTTVIHGNTKATLGERFLKFQTVKTTSFSAEAEARIAINTMGQESKREEELQSIVAAFIDRDVRCTAAQMQNMTPEWVRSRVIALGHLIAMLRATVDRDPYRPDFVLRKPQHESPVRLISQLIRLGIGLCMVDGKKKIDMDVYRIMERVAFDTALGFHLEIVQAIMHEEGLADRESLVKLTSMPQTNLTRAIEDLRMLGVVRRSDPGKTSVGTGVKYEYALTKKARTWWNKAEVTSSYLGRERRNVTRGRRRKDYHVEQTENR